MRGGPVIRALTVVVGASSPPAEVTEVAARIALLQRRSGQSSSYKGHALQSSPWQLDDRGPLLEASPTIGLYRIIGNPLPPRHDVNQLRENLRFLLQHEPALPRARKIFVLNRLNKTLEKKAASLIRSYGHDVLTIRFDVAEYRAHQMTDTYGLHPSEWGDLITPKFAQLNQNLYVINNNGARNTALRHGIRRGWAWTLPFDGNCFFTLEKWSALVSELDAAALRNVAYIAVPLVRTTVATLRKRDNAPPGLAANPERGEPQLAFSSAARLRFDPTVPYGHRPKVSMLWKLGVPGVWDSWNHDAVFRAEKKCEYIGVKRKVKPPSVCRRSLPEVDDEAANATLSTDEAVVFRLPDVWTKSAVSGDDYSSRHQRRDARDLGVKIRLDSINRAIVSSSRDASVFVKPLFFNVFSMEAMRRECNVHKSQSNTMLRQIWGTTDHHCIQIAALIQMAESYLSVDRETLVDEEKVTASSERGCPQSLRRRPRVTVHHFQSIAPLEDWRPGEITANFNDPEQHFRSSLRTTRQPSSGANDLSIRRGAKEKRIDGAHKGFAHLYDVVTWEDHSSSDGGKLRRPSSAAFDGAARAYEMMSNVTLFALAHFYSGDPRFSEKSVRLVRAWFLDPKTRMPPTKSFSRCSAPTNRGGASYMKELTYALDAVALVERTTAWTQRDAIGMQRWCAKYLDSLATSRDRTLKNSQSWWYVLQYAAVARCVDSNNATTRQLQEFVAAQVARFLTPTYVDVDGILLYEIGRTRSLQNHFVGSHALVLAWRLLQNLGDVTSADAVADVLRRTAAVIDVTLRSVPRNCDIDHQAAHITTVRRAKLLEDACEIGIDLARESATPLCQWAFDLDAEFGATLSMCWRRHARSTPPGHRDVSPPFPTAAIEEFEWPPLLPSDPDSQQHLFPFQNTMW